MCRLFAFRSSVAGRVHEALVEEQNSLQVQSNEHKDGWGIAFYEGPCLEVARGLGPAHADPEFRRVSQHLSSQAVLAHVRLASVGSVTLPNAHPFQFERWTFAHNGTLSHFETHRAAIEALIAPKFLPHIRGETDSERCFYVFLTRLQCLPGGLERPTAQSVSSALAGTMQEVSSLVDSSAQEPSSLNFVVTNGEVMAASRRNRPLFFSEWKKKRETPHLEPTSGTPLRQFIVSSEKTSSQDHWHEISQDEIVSVNQALVFHRGTLSQWLAG